MHEKTESKVVRATCERLEKVLVGLRQGGMGLYQRLLSYHPQLLDPGEAVPVIEESATTSAITAAYDTLKMLTLTETVLGKMLDHIGGGEGSPSRFAVMTNDDDPSLDTSTVSSAPPQDDDDDENAPNLGVGNIRIGPKKAEPTVPPPDDGGQDNFDDLHIDDASAVSNMVPSRAFLKMSSGRQAGEALRLRSAVERKRLLQERLDAADSAEREMLTSTTALQKRQADANDRLSRHHHPVGLPKQLKVRDDAMTKAQVFMTEMPKLD